MGGSRDRAAVKRWFACAFPVVALVAGMVCASAPMSALSAEPRAVPPPATPPPATPPPVETFFRKADYVRPELSPSGRYLAVIAPIEGQHGVAVIDLQTHSTTRMKTPGGGDIVRVVWQNDERLIVVIGDLQRVTGEPPKESGIIAVNRDGGDSRVIAGASDFNLVPSSIADKGFRRPWSVSLLRAIPGTNQILVTARERNVASADLYRYDTETGEKTLLSFDTPGDVARWVVDFDGVARAAVTDDVGHDLSAWYVRKDAKSPWIKIEQAKLGDLQSQPMQFDPAGRILYVAARRGGADRAATYEYTIDSGAWKSAVSHPLRDIDFESAGFVADYKEHKLLGLRYADDRLSTVWFDADWGRMQKSIDAALPDTVNLLQRSGDRWIVTAFSDQDPGEAYLLDGKTMQMQKLLSFAPWIDPTALSPTRWVHYAARDGMTIPALLTVPSRANGKPVPLVVDIHGGPNVPAAWWSYAPFDPEVQFLASRGYAVLRPQFRGTLGFGWRLESSGFRHWGDTMQDDLEDGVKWAIAQRIADPDRVCFYGASYGGYAAIWGAIRNAGVIKCSVAYVGVTSIDYLFDNAQTDLSDLADKSSAMRERIGDPKTDRAAWKRVNPLDNADRVGVPILLAYGASDLRVPLVHGTDFRAALDKYHKPYEWVVYANEGHGFTRDADLFDFYGRVERFLAKYLGGYAAPEMPDATPQAH